MKTCYVDYTSRAIADLVQPGELTEFWTITRINVPVQHRGQGLGTRLLRQILADADVNGITLALEPSPENLDDYDRLVAWYRRHGFKMRHTGYMVRRPLKS